MRTLVAARSTAGRAGRFPGDPDRQNLPSVRSHPFTMAEFRQMGCTPCIPPVRCSEGHLCDFMPCMTCVALNAKKNGT